MLRRTFEVSNQDDAARVADALRGLAGGQALLRAFVYGFSHEETEALLRPIRAAVPCLIVTGMTMFTAEPPPCAARWRNTTGSASKRCFRKNTPAAEGRSVFA